MSSDPLARLVKLKSRRGEIIAKLNSLKDSLYTQELSEREKRIVARDIDTTQKDLHEIDLEIKIEKKATMNLGHGTKETPLESPLFQPTNTPHGAYIEDITDDESCKNGAQTLPTRPEHSNTEPSTPLSFSSHINTGTIPKTPTLSSILKPKSNTIEHQFRKESMEDKANRLEIENMRLRNHYEKILKGKQNFELKKSTNLKTTQNSPLPNPTQIKFEPYRLSNLNTPQRESFTYTQRNDQRKGTQNISEDPPFALLIPSGENQPVETQPLINTQGEMMSPLQRQITPIARNVPQEIQNPQNEIIRGTEKPRDTFLRRLRSIPIFSGESYTELKDFVDITDTLFYSCTNESEENEFYDQMMLQLRGEARQIIINNEDPNWENIKIKLLAHFAHLSNREIIASKLENLHQNEKETITEYAERARKLLIEKNRIYTHLTEDQRLEHNRTARRAFSKGITNQKLKERLTIRGANTLEDAIAYAIESENDALNEIATNELYCQFCRSPGHRQKDCRRKNSENSGISQLIAALRGLNNTNQNRRMSNFNQNRDNRRNSNNWSNNDNNNGWNRNNSNRFNNGGWNQNSSNSFNNNRNWNNNPNRNWNNNRNNITPSNETNNSGRNGNGNGNSNNNNNSPNNNQNRNNQNRNAPQNQRRFNNNNNQNSNSFTMQETPINHVSPENLPDFQPEN